jgi:IclR family acetate operon transcriptional repressor
VTESEAFPRGTLGTVRNASLLLDLLSKGPALQQLTELAERSNLSLPTVHRLLRSLVAAGLVEQEPRSSRYSLGPELVRLSERYLERLPLLQGLAPYLVGLRRQTEATPAVALLVRDEVVYVDRVEGRDRGLFQRPGRTFPAATTASGRLLLGRAHPEAQAACLRRLGDDGPPQELLDEWGAAAHVMGASTGVGGEVEIAVPVVDWEGMTVAALAATGAPPFLTPEKLVADVLPLLQHTADLASRILSNA